MRHAYRWAPILIGTAWIWILVVLGVTFWRMWDIPKRLPEINEIATTHLFLFPISLLLFLTLSWMRQQRDEGAEATPSVRTFPRWRATMGIWLLALLHPVSCALYPAMFDLDKRTVEQITGAVAKMQAGMSRADVEREILALNATLPISMETDQGRHQADTQAVAQYLSVTDPAERRRLWPMISRATQVFVPRGPNGHPPALDSSEQFFQRRLRSSSDIGVDRIKVRYNQAGRVEEVIYSSNRQLTEDRRPCTVHWVTPAPPDASFPYPCPS